MTYPGSPDHDPYLTAADKARKARIKSAWDAYNGEIPHILKEPVAGQPDLRMKVNLCAPAVDNDVTFLAGQPLKITVEQGGNGGETPTDRKNPAQEYLDGVIGDPDEFMTLLSEMVQNGSVSGHAFLKLIHPDETGTGYASIINLDPATVTVQTDPDNVRVAQSYCIEYDACDAAGNVITKRQIIARVDPDQRAALEENGIDKNAQWTITNYTRSGGMGAQFVKDTGPVLPWPHPWAPIVENQHLPLANEFWGKPTLTPDYIHLNQMLNGVKSNTNLLIYVTAYGIPWNDAGDDTPAAVEPGRWINFPPGTNVGVVDTHGDIANSMAFEKAIRGDMGELSGNPGIATGRAEDVPRGQVSGPALQTYYAKRLAVTTHGRRLYGRTIKRLCQYALELGGFPPNLKITLTWGNPLPVDDLELAQTALAMEQAGASTATGLRKMGLDPDEEQEAKASEAQDQMTAFAQGQGLPPTEPLPDGNEPQQPGQDTSGLNPNHSAAVAARAKMQAAFS